MHAIRKSLLLAAGVMALSMPSIGRASPFLIIGNDEKIVWDDEGKPVLSPPGKDSVVIVDLAKPEEPKIVANLPLENTVVGPPVNMAISPSGDIALVANSIDLVQDGGALKQVPDDRIWVIDMKANPPKLAATVKGGKQPSGLSISPSGTMALVTNREDKSITVLSINGTDVKVADTIAMGDSVAHVAISPDGKRALAVKFPAHKVALLDIAADGKVTYNKYDIAVGLWPYNVDFTPDGKLAMTADNGGAGSADGNVDTISIIDMEANPPRVIDKVVVGDGPEGFAISPAGGFAAAALLRGSNASKKAFFYNKNGLTVLLRIDGKKVTKLKEIEVGGLPEPVAFTPDGKYIYVGNFLDKNFSILRIDGNDLVDTGKKLMLDGHPAAARMSPK
jgi:DNA-binding beta-propeller fold protein YncE